ncbi:MAG: hypothetical protein HRT45_05840 [Bdellovibrionales bacterium]|nr:hypothetical protein [Bdellovibrionales bacterium]
MIASKALLQVENRSPLAEKIAEDLGRFWFAANVRSKKVNAGDSSTERLKTYSVEIASGVLKESARSHHKDLKKYSDATLHSHAYWGDIFLQLKTTDPCKAIGFLSEQVVRAGEVDAINSLNECLAKNLDSEKLIHSPKHFKKPFSLVGLKGEQRVNKVLYLKKVGKRGTACLESRAGFLEVSDNKSSLEFAVETVKLCSRQQVLKSFETKFENSEFRKSLHKSSNADLRSWVALDFLKPGMRPLWTSLKEFASEFDNGPLMVQYLQSADSAERRGQVLLSLQGLSHRADIVAVALGEVSARLKQRKYKQAHRLLSNLYPVGAEKMPFEVWQQWALLSLSDGSGIQLDKVLLAAKGLKLAKSEKQKRKAFDYSVSVGELTLIEDNWAEYSSVLGLASASEERFFLWALGLEQVRRARLFSHAGALSQALESLVLYEKSMRASLSSGKSTKAIPRDQKLPTGFGSSVVLMQKTDRFLEKYRGYKGSALAPIAGYIKLFETIERRNHLKFFHAYFAEFSNQALTSLKQIIVSDSSLSDDERSEMVAQLEGWRMKQ